MKYRCFSVWLLAFAFLRSLHSLAQPNPVIVPFVSGFTRPVKVAHGGDARLFVAEIGGKIKVVKNGNVLDEPFLDISGKINDPEWAGIYSVAFAPEFQISGKFYVLYVLKNSTEVQLSEFKRSTSNADLADAASEVKILTIPYEDVLGGHRGGDMAFGKDGYLYVSTGDNGPGSRGDIGDPNNNSQNIAKVFGKILKLDMKSPSPAENILTKIFALGLRNPWRFSFDRSTGDLWLGDNGQDAWEEVNYLEYPFNGSVPNFGWNCLEATQTYDASHCAPGTIYTPPKYTYAGFANNGGSNASVMGGYVYRGSKYRSLNGYYFFGDYQSGKIGLLSPAGVGTFPAGLTYSSLISFGEDQVGELYVLSFLNGTLSKITNLNDPLPVQLAYFNARIENQSVILAWRMAAAQYFKEFQLQRSGDGRKFENIATLPDAGTEHTYSFIDSQPMSGENFYRLKIIDQDGSYQYSKIVSAGLSNAGSSITIFPNPSEGIFNIKSLKDECNITLGNASGNVIFTKKVRSENDLEINLKNHPAGTYTIRIVNQATKISETRHLVKD